jgi:hypothetical protein
MKAPRFILSGLVLLATACSSSVNADKMAQIKTGMKVSEVEARLGRPNHIDQSETTGLRGEVYHYPGANGEGQVVILNDTVFDSKFIAGAGGT